MDADRTSNSRNAPWPFWLRVVILTIAVACWGYAFARAQHVAFTYDESLTMRFVDRPLYEIVTFTKPIANKNSALFDFGSSTNNFITINVSRSDGLQPPPPRLNIMLSRPISGYNGVSFTVSVFAGRFSVSL